MLPIGLVFLAIGWVLHHWVERRKFYRRDQFGNDVHGNYSGMLGAKFIESVAGLIGGTASLIGCLIVLFQGLIHFGVLH